MCVLLPAQTKIGVSEGDAGGSGSPNCRYNPFAAVRPANGMVAASFIDTDFGRGIDRVAGTRAYSANAPVPSSMNAPIQMEAIYC